MWRKGDRRKGIDGVLTSSLSQAIMVPKLTSPQRQYLGSFGSMNSSSTVGVAAAGCTGVVVAAAVSSFLLPPFFFGAALRLPTLTLVLPSSSAVIRPGAGLFRRPRPMAWFDEGAVSVAGAGELRFP